MVAGARNGWKVLTYDWYHLQISKRPTGILSLGKLPKNYIGRPLKPTFLVVRKWKTIGKSFLQQKGRGTSQTISGSWRALLPDV
jgi:hypothetical protein